MELNSNARFTMASNINFILTIWYKHFMENSYCMNGTIEIL